MKSLKLLFLVNGSIKAFLTHTFNSNPKKKLEEGGIVMLLWSQSQNLWTNTTIE